MQHGTSSSLTTDEALAWLTVLSLPPPLTSIESWHQTLYQTRMGGGVRHLVFEVVAEGTRTETGDENNMTDTMQYE